MAYPKLLDLEAIADLITSKRTSRERIEIAGRAVPAPLRNFSDLDPDVQERYLAVFSSDFLTQFPQKVRVYNRGKRLGRLAGGIYEVAVPGGDDFLLGDWEVEIPTVQAQVFHTRTKQTKAAHRSLTQRSLSPSSAVELGDWGPSSELFELQDMKTHVAGSEAATLYSELIVLLPSLKGWGAVAREYEGWYTAVFEPFINGIEGRAATADSPGKLQELEKKLEKNKQEFVEEHKETILNYLMLHELMTVLHARTLDHFYTQYSLLVHGRVTPTGFPSPTSFAMDSEKRILWKHGLIHQPLLYLDREDLATAPLEALPFGDEFHDEFQKALLGPSRQLKGYQKQAEDILMYANELVHLGRYAAAVTQAEAAFEVALSGFLEEAGVNRLSRVGHAEQMSLRKMTGRFFDEAVRRVTGGAYLENQFEPKILQKIVRMRGSGNQVLHDIRNKIIHEGEHEQVTPEIAQLACLVYGEAIQYIQEQGWLKHGAPLLTSDVVLAVTPALREYMPRRIERDADIIVSKAARQLKFQMSYDERDRYGEIHLPRWARDVFKR